MEQNTSKVWLTLGVVAVLALVLGYYFYSANYSPSDQQAAKEEVKEEQEFAGVAAEAEAMNLDDLGAEMADIEAEVK